MVASGSRRIRGVLTAASRARDMRARRPPGMTIVPAPGLPPVVYYLTPDDNTPRGGVRVNYRHVDVLNKAGIDAAVLHSRRGFRCDWFANDTRVVGAPDLRLGAQDILVLPEFYAPGFHLLPTQPRKVVFNQGPYYTFARVPFRCEEPAGAPYTTLANLVSMVTVSRDGADLLRYGFPDLPVHAVRSVVDPQLFRPARPPADSPAGRRVAYLPRRRQQQRDQVLHMLQCRGALDGWELVPIHGVSEQRTAELMRGSAIFLSFSEREGFGLPPAEAMASGCYVVGFTGMGGRDYFDPAYCAPVPEDDVLAFARAAEEAMRRYDADPDGVRAAGLRAAERIHGEYHEEGLRDDLVSVFGPLVGTART